MSPLAGFVQLVLHFRDMRLILGAKVGSWQSGLRVAIGHSLSVWALLHGFGLRANMIPVFHSNQRLHSRYGHMQTWCLLVPPADHRQLRRAQETMTIHELLHMSTSTRCVLAPRMSSVCATNTNDNQHMASTAAFFLSVQDETKEPTFQQVYETLETRQQVPSHIM